MSESTMAGNMKSFMRRCAVCSEPLSRGMRSDAIYCGQRCNRRSRTVTGRRTLGMVPEYDPERNCVICGSALSTRQRKDALYCGRECRQKSKSVAARTARGLPRHFPSYKGSEPTRNAEYTIKKGRMLLPPRRSPFRVLARSCPRCGELLVTPAHLILKTSGRLPRCRGCAVRASHKVKQQRLARGDEEYRRYLRDHGDDKARRVQARTAGIAVNTRKEWTGPELELVADYDRSAQELAKLLNRTYYAVKHMRHKLLHDPRKQWLAGRRSSLH